MLCGEPGNSASHSHHLYSIVYLYHSSASLEVTCLRSLGWRTAWKGLFLMITWGCLTSPRHLPTLCLTSERSSPTFLLAPSYPDFKTEPQQLLCESRHAPQGAHAAAVPVRMRAGTSHAPRCAPAPCAGLALRPSQGHMWGTWKSELSGRAQRKVALLSKFKVTPPPPPGSSQILQGTHLLPPVLATRSEDISLEFMAISIPFEVPMIAAPSHYTCHSLICVSPPSRL